MPDGFPVYYAGRGGWAGGGGVDISAAVRSHDFVLGLNENQ